MNGPIEAEVAESLDNISDMVKKYSPLKRLTDEAYEKGFRNGRSEITAQLTASEAARVAAEARVGELEVALSAIADKDDAGDHLYRADGPLAKIARAALKGANP